MGNCFRFPPVHSTGSHEKHWTRFFSDFSKFMIFLLAS